MLLGEKNEPACRHASARIVAFGDQPVVIARGRRFIHRTSICRLSRPGRSSARRPQHGRSRAAWQFAQEHRGLRLRQKKPGVNDSRLLAESFPESAAALIFGSLLGSGNRRVEALAASLLVLLLLKLLESLQELVHATIHLIQAFFQTKIARRERGRLSGRRETAFRR